MTVDFDSAAQALQITLRHDAVNTTKVFAFYFISRMHQPVCKIAIRAKQHHPSSIDVKTTHGYPTPMLVNGQIIEHRRPIVGIVTGYDFSNGFVVDQNF